MDRWPEVECGAPAALDRTEVLATTVDPAELADTVRASLTRTFTATECTSYGIDPCPTREEMRAP